MKGPNLASSIGSRLALVAACALLATAFALLSISPTYASQAPVFRRHLAPPGGASLLGTNVLTIGVAADLTGAYASSVGWPVANSVQLAISETNAAGGINVGGVTYTLSLVVADSAAGTACNAIQAVTAAESLLDAGVVAVVGHTCSDQTRLVEPTYAAAGVPLIGVSCTFPDVTQQGYDIMFRTIPHDGSPPGLLASYFRKSLGLSTVAIVEGATATLPADSFRDAFTMMGGSITSRRIVTDSSDFASALGAIQAENPKGIAVINANLDPAAAGQFSQMAHNVGMTNVVIGWYSWTSDESALTTYAAAAGATAAQGDVAAMLLRRSQDMPGWPAYLAAYTAAGFPNATNTPGEFGPTAYDAARIIIAAMSRAGTASPSSIRTAMASMQNHQGVVGTYQGFDAHGDVIPQWAWLAQYKNGQWVIMRPGQLFIPLTMR